MKKIRPSQKFSGTSRFFMSMNSDAATKAPITIRLRYDDRWWVPASVNEMMIPTINHPVRDHAVDSDISMWTSATIDHRNKMMAKVSYANIVLKPQNPGPIP